MPDQFISRAEIFPTNYYNYSMYKLLSIIHCGYQQYRIDKLNPEFIKLLELIDDLQNTKKISNNYIYYPQYYQSSTNTKCYYIPDIWFTIQITKYQTHSYYLKYNSQEFFTIYTKNLEPLQDFIKSMYI